MKDFAIPSDLSPTGKALARLIVATVRTTMGKDASGGGCSAFYSPAAWKARGEKYSEGAALIVVHDGGDLAPFFNMDYEAYSLEERMGKALKTLGARAEPATCWFTCIYID